MKSLAAMITLNVLGFVKLDNFGETSSVLWIDDIILSKSLTFLSGQTVTFKMWSATQPRSIEQLNEAITYNIVGGVESGFEEQYSEITGYLWTDENLNIGNHSIIDILHSFVGKWVYLLFTIHP